MASAFIGVVIGFYAAIGDLHSAASGCVDIGKDCSPNFIYNIVIPALELTLITAAVVERKTGFFFGHVFDGRAQDGVGQDEDRSSDKQDGLSSDG
jgi:hypothetical protein